MDTAQLKKFAQQARRMLMEQIAARLSFVLEAESSARRETPQSVKDLEKQIAESSKESVIEKTAYIWFNRFCALRFMDVNRYTRIGTVSPAEGFTQPEILMEAKQGHIDDGFSIDKGKVFDLLNGIIPSQVPQQEAFRMLLVSACNHYNRIMPFLFERISDYTELLMPDDLLSESSILSLTIEALSPEACENVEVIGWLYQFYISEKKDEVFDGLKKNKKITPANIPAATQLFTPNWIVRYLVENSLGRLWMLNKPGSRLVERMEYYIGGEGVDSGEGVVSGEWIVDSKSRGKGDGGSVDYLKILSPEEIKICDPACGSGHMLVYAFDILYSIYEEEGYDANVIPGLILEKNLYGIEIDERAGELAAFALTMKAREKYRRFFNKPVQPNICVLENVQSKENELKNYMDEMGHDLFTSGFQNTLRQFEEADNFGALIRPAMKDAAHIHNLIKEKNISGQLLLHVPHQKVLKVLKQADYLSQKYHVVIANPPYMGGKGMNGRLGAWAKDNYPDSKSDLFAMFIERNLDLVFKKGSVAMITMQSWMFLSSFEKLRSRILDNETILSMAHLGARAFDSIGGEVVQTTAFVLGNSHNPDYKGAYIRLVDGSSEAEKARMLREAIR